MDDDDEEQTETAELERILTQEQNAPLRSTGDDDRMFNLSCAAIALSLDDINTVHNFSEPTLAEQTSNTDEDRQNINAALTQLQIAPLNLAEVARPYDHSQAFVNSYDFSNLAAIRREHETKQAANGDQAVGTGLERKARWQSNAARSSLTGNSANAILAAGQRASTLYEQAHQTRFRAILQDVAILQCFSFAHMSSDQFLCRLPGSHHITTDGRTLELDNAAFATFAALSTPSCLSRIVTAVKMLGTARKKAKKVATSKAKAANGDHTGSESEDV
ncbi:predicted protein [Postia placenta Mad-698-R]|nr:predicted protein [Postia placenta Mad-698-R]